MLLFIIIFIRFKIKGLRNEISWRKMSGLCAQVFDSSLYADSHEAEFREILNGLHFTETTLTAWVIKHYIFTLS